MSHALGYLLGDALHRSLESGAVSRKALRGLFADPLTDARAVYFRLVRGEL